MGRTAAADVVLLVALVALAAVLVAASRFRALRSRPELPVEDRAPAGLGRLVPVGPQLEQDCRRGLVTLELWLVQRRRQSTAERKDVVSGV